MKVLKMCLNLIMAYLQNPYPIITHIPYFGSHFASTE